MVSNQHSIKTVPKGAVRKVILMNPDGSPQPTRWGYFIPHPLIATEPQGSVAVKVWVDGSGQTLIIRTDGTCLFKTREDARAIAKDLLAIRNQRDAKLGTWPTHIVFQW